MISPLNCPASCSAMRSRNCSSILDGTEAEVVRVMGLPFRYWAVSWPRRGPRPTRSLRHRVLRRACGRGGDGGGDVLRRGGRGGGGGGGALGQAAHGVQGGGDGLEVVAGHRVGVLLLGGGSALNALDHQGEAETELEVVLGALDLVGDGAEDRTRDAGEGHPVRL